uniref:Uncharacterized protein n=1 Tax=Triticum urartu TaxID=4572 RepID=A0A8R7QS36_TRIUA
MASPSNISQQQQATNLQTEDFIPSPFARNQVSLYPLYHLACLFISYLNMLSNMNNPVILYVVFLPFYANIIICSDAYFFL